MDLHVAYGDAAVFLGAEPRFSLLDALENIYRLDAEFLKSLVVKTASGLELLASADRTASAPIDTRRLSEVVQLAASQYAYTVLDVPRSDLTILDGLDRVDTIAVVVNQELATVQNAGRLTATLKSRYPNAKVTTVINRIDPRAEIGQRDVEKALGGASAHECPSDYRRALTAMHTGRPLALDNHNALSASFTTLARELAGIERVKTAKASGGFKAFLSGRR
jgi:Flp pilus assembly CpaE family ATPase